MLGLPQGVRARLDRGRGRLRRHARSRWRAELQTTLTPALTRLAFGLTFRGRQLRIEVGQKQAAYALHDGEPMDLAHYGESITVAAGTPLTRPIPLLVPREAPSQPPGRAPARRRRQT